MSFGRLQNRYQGNRSEQIARPLLSALGQAIPVAREEDSGFDYLCSVGYPEGSMLLFANQFLVSIKSASEPNIEVKPRKKWDGDYPEHITGMFDLDLPLLLGVVNRKEKSLSLFSTLAAYYIRYEKFERCGSLALVPRINDATAGDVGFAVEKEPLNKYPNKFHYEVDLGWPMFTMNATDAENPERIEWFRNRLDWVLKFSFASLRYAKMCVPYYYWFARTLPDSSQYAPAFFCREFPLNQDTQQQILTDLAPPLISWAFHCQTTGKHEELASVGKLLLQAPQWTIHEEVRKRLPEIFGKEGNQTPHSQTVAKPHRQKVAKRIGKDG